MGFDIDELRRRLPSAKQVASDFYGVAWRGNKAKCPRAENHAHGDRDPSFVFLSEENRLHCFSQLCFGDRPVDVFDFVRRMEGCGFQAAGQRLAEWYGLGTMRREPQNNRTARRESTRAQLEREGWKAVAEYAMGDGVRKIRFEHPDRIQPEKGRPEKTFVWEHRAEDGTWKPGRAGRPHHAYVNATFRERDQIESALGVESERSADAAGTLGLPAFSFKELTPKNSVSFVGIDLRLLADKDDAGRKLMNKRIELLRPHARSIAVIEPPGDWPDAGDLYDAVAEMGWTREQVEALIATAKPVPVNTSGPEQNAKRAPLSPQNRPIVLSVAELLALEVPESKVLIDGLLPRPGASLLFGAPKSNKTLLAIQMAIAVASGKPLFDRYRVPEPGPVLVVEQDDPAGASSVRTILQRSPIPVEGIPFHLVSRLTFTFGPQLIEWLEEQITTEKLLMVVLDSYTSLRSPRKSGIDIVKAEQQELTRLDDLAKRTGCTIVVIHHDSKGSAGMDWSQKAAGTFAMSAATEAQIHISRFSDFDGSAPERLLRVRGRHMDGIEMVLRFRRETLDHEWVLEGGAAVLYPSLVQLQAAFGTQAFSPKDCLQVTGWSRSSVHRCLDRLCGAGALSKRGYGEYVLTSARHCNTGET